MENLERVLNDLNNSFDSLFKIIETNSTYSSNNKKYIIMRNIYDFESKFKEIINCMNCVDNPFDQTCGAIVKSDCDEYEMYVYPDDFDSEFSDDIEIAF